MKILAVMTILVVVFGSRERECSRSIICLIQKCWLPKTRDRNGKNLEEKKNGTKRHSMGECIIFAFKFFFRFFSEEEKNYFLIKKRSRKENTYYTLICSFFS
jgi:hypothetical protein